jgi:apolipoprotein N-acyltransferase
MSDMNIYKNLFSNHFSEDDLIVMGINSRGRNGNTNLFFNSMAIFNNKLDLIQKYNKVNLVPFGEFIPFENILALIGLKTITNEYQSFSGGSIRKPINIKNNKINLNLLPLICYEIIYSGKLSDDINFDYIFNISEDGWFGNSIGPKQHFSHSIFRSIESGKYIVRSANNGISAIINPVGFIEQKVEFGSIGYVELTTSKLIKSTPFMLFGNKIFLIVILLYIFLIFSFNRLRNE